MSFWKALSNAIHPDETSPREWHCEPLAIRNMESGETLFAGNGTVEVTPLSPTTASLAFVLPDSGRRIFVPIATIRTFPNDIRYDLRPGMVCTGDDENGDTLKWSIKGAAEYAFERWPTVRISNEGP